MKLIRDIAGYYPSGPLFLALGNFDGVHLGHQKLIGECVQSAHEQQGTSAAYIFEPHPAKIIDPAKAPQMLVTAERKAELLETLGLDVLIYTPFTPEVARCSPREFVQSILVDRLQVSRVVVGFNYSFGFRGAGTPELLAQLGQQLGFEVAIMDPVEVNSQVVSSSSIRQAMKKGDLELASKMLGYSPRLTGRVVEGEHRGALLGFPTANLDLPPELAIPGRGVYAGIAQVGQHTFKAVVNIGSKPTFHDEHPLTIEVHLLGLNESIYGQLVDLVFLQKIRDERRFAGVEELIEQIRRDRDAAEKIAVIPS